MKTAIILGFILTLLLSSWGLIFWPAAVIVGFIALSKIKKNPERFKGKGAAWAGIILGGVGSALVIFFLLAFSGVI